MVAYLGDDYLAPSVISALNEVGPYRAVWAGDEVKIERNIKALTNRANVVFIDTPIGNGKLFGVPISTEQQTRALLPFRL